MTVWTYSRVFMSEIIAEVGHVFDVPEAGLLGRARIRKIVQPRFVCAYLGKQLTPLSLPQIGRHLGGRDHTTILHGIDRAEALMSRSAEFTAYVDAVRIRLLTTRNKAEQRRNEARQAIWRRLLKEQLENERLAREAEAPAETDDMDDLSNAVAAYVANGGSFIEVYA